jgi:hypothetical protein
MEIMKKIPLDVGMIRLINGYRNRACDFGE